MYPRIVLAGGSGFIGQSLSRKLAEKDWVNHPYEVVILSRTPRSPDGPIHYKEWDGKTLGPWGDLVDGAEAIINLTGKSVNCRYTKKNRQEIVDSRVDSIRILGEAILKCKNPPKVFIQSSSLAIYGDSKDRICDENAPPGQGFSVETCLIWEKTFNELKIPQIRKVLLRIGFVLGREGGVLDTLVGLTKKYLGGTVGNGQQYISWLHEDDLNEMFAKAIENPNMQGVYNATGPNPVTNQVFMKELRSVLKKPWSPPAPRWALYIGAWFMRTEPSLALTGRRCLPVRLTQENFKFRNTDLKRTLEQLLK